MFQSKQICMLLVIYDNYVTLSCASFEMVIHMKEQLLRQIQMKLLLCCELIPFG